MGEGSSGEYDLTLRSHASHFAVEYLGRLRVDSVGVSEVPTLNPKPLGFGCKESGVDAGLCVSTGKLSYLYHLYLPRIMMMMMTMVMMKMKMKPKMNMKLKMKLYMKMNMEMMIMVVMMAGDGDDDGDDDSDDDGDVEL